MNADPLVTLRVLWAAILSATIAFLVIPVSAGDAATGPTLLLPFAFVALGSAVASVFLPRYVLAQGLAKLELQTVEVDDPERAFGSMVRKRRVFRDPELALRAGYRVHQTAMILGLALAEAVAIYGFVLKFLGAELSSVAPFFVVSWALILYRFPRRSVIAHSLERAYRIGPLE